MVYKLKITMIFGAYIPEDEDIERVFEAEGKVDLYSLIHALLNSLDFDFDHLYEYQIRKNTYGGSPMGSEGENPTLDELKLRKGSKFRLVYDFGDDWMVRITASLDACDLVEQGRVTQQELDEAIASIYKTYRPVCIAADGMYLVDDAGGLSGYIRFLRSINPAAEKEYWGKDLMPDNWAYEDKQSSLEWARSLGWTDRINAKRML